LNLIHFKKGAYDFISFIDVLLVSFHLWYIHTSSSPLVTAFCFIFIF